MAILVRVSHLSQCLLYWISNLKNKIVMLSYMCVSGSKSYIVSDFRQRLHTLGMFGNTFNLVRILVYELG